MNIKNLIFKVMGLLPSSKKNIIFESPDVGDNSKKLYEKLISKSDKYNIVWIVKDIEKNKKIYPEIRFLTIDSPIYNFYYRWRARYCFYTHNYIGVPGKKNQVRCFLTHGIPIKDTRNCFWDPDINTDIICTSEKAAKLRCKTFGGGHDLVRILGFPRNDELLEENSVRDKLGISKKEKLIVWMPTFKHHSRDSRSDMEVEKSSDIGLLNDVFMKRMNKFLEQNNAYLIIKFHPYQDMKYVGNISFSRTMTYTNQELADLRISVYQLLATSDALITDFSSVYLDYLICDKPIGFDLCDIDNYARGFLVDDPLTLMPGEKIKSERDFLKFCSDVIEGNDMWQSERCLLKNEMHKYSDSSASDRILEFFNLC